MIDYCVSGKRKTLISACYEKNGNVGETGASLYGPVY